MTPLNRTKIVATLGPASRGDANIETLIRHGVDVFRLNAAHSDHRQLVRDIGAIRRVARRIHRAVGILVDLQGPKIRVGPLRDAEPIWLKRGQTLVLGTEPGLVGQAAPEGEPVRVGCSYVQLPRDVRPRERILLDDGNLEVKVTRVVGRDVHTTVVYGGLLKQYKGINLPGSKLSVTSLSAKDLADLRVVLGVGADFIALSFVRSADDIRRLKAEIRRAGSDAQVIAKIERPEAVKVLPAILAEADGLMVARGDMGVELGPEAVPILQKRIIRMAIEACKPVITATQMLESMVTNPRPTRAEASDVANAIYDGTSAVMLSAETASGKYPFQAVRVMEQIIRRAEEDIFSRSESLRRRRITGRNTSVTAATIRAAAYAAMESGARLIAVFTERGTSAEILAAERPATRMIAFTPFQRTVQRLTLSWGMRPIRSRRSRTSHEMTLEAERVLLEQGLARRGDRVVLIVGATRRMGMTNVMHIRTLE
ncbi:MAG: pyruvate kinase [Planctomycetes bacterium]|nr:pyruvate kinase [Planctomycetota bacterium]